MALKIRLARGGSPVWNIRLPTSTDRFKNRVEDPQQEVFPVFEADTVDLSRMRLSTE